MMSMNAVKLSICILKGKFDAKNQIPLRDAPLDRHCLDIYRYVSGGVFYYALSMPFS